MTECDEHSKLVTTWTVTPEESASRVEIASAWEASGVVGFLERLFAPRAMRRLYAEELELLDRYVREQAASASAARGRLSESESADAPLVPAQVMGELMAQGPLDLAVEKVGLMPEVAFERVAIDHDPVLVV